MIYFTSDIHLNKANTRLNNNFITWINSLPDNTEYLYLLGDIFDAWHPSYISGEWCQKIIQCLNNNSKRFKIFIMHGNHDFLLNQAFAKLANINLITEDDILVGDYILLHGDTLSLNDTSYQLMRKIIRANLTQTIYYNLRLTTQLKIIELIKSNNKSNYTSFTARAINNLHKKYPTAKKIICGHFHQARKITQQTSIGSIEVISMANWKNDAAYFLTFNN